MLSLSKWQQERGLSNREAAVLLGCDRNAYNRYASGLQPMPLYIRLAVSALAMNLPPISSKP